MNTTNTRSTNSVAAQTILTEWLSLRQTVLIAYQTLNRIPPFDDVNYESDQALFKQFCQTLLDYATQGHMSFFKSLEKPRWDYVSPVQTRLSTLKHLLEENSLTIFRFSEKPTLTIEKIDQKVKQQLSHIGEVFANRIELEDELISLLMSEH